MCFYYMFLSYLGHTLLFKIYTEYYVLCVVVAVTLATFYQFGCTALHYASRQGHTEIVKLLKNSGADVDFARTVNSLPNH